MYKINTKKIYVSTDVFNNNNIVHAYTNSKDAIVAIQNGLQVRSLEFVLNNCYFDGTKELNLIAKDIFPDSKADAKKFVKDYEKTHSNHIMSLKQL